MANTRSAEKNIRKTKARTLRNQSTKSRVRTIRKRVLAAIDKGDLTAARTELSAFASAADKAAKTKVFKTGTVNRLKSRLAQRIKKTDLAAAAAK